MKNWIKNRFVIVFGSMSVGRIAGVMIKQRRRNWLLKNGRMIDAALIGVLQKKSIRVKGVSPFILQCQWHDRGQNRVFVFESDPVWFNPECFLTGNLLRVLIDPRNPKRYWVDLSFLPELGN